MSRTRTDRKLPGTICPVGASPAWIWIAVVCAVFFSYLGSPVLSARADETEMDSETADSGMTAASGTGIRGVTISGTDEESVTQIASADEIHAAKSLIENGDGSLQVELENYVTGEAEEAAEEADPADILLLFDHSNSMKWALTEDTTRIEAACAAVESFIEVLAESNEGLEEEDQSRLALVTYNGYSYLTYDFTAVNAETKETLIDQTVNDNCSGQTWTDYAIAMAKDVFDARTDTSRRKVILFLTDGYPNGNDTAGTPHGGFVPRAANLTLKRAQALKADGTEIYCISINPRADAGCSSLPEYEKVDATYYLTPEDVENGEDEDPTTDEENAAALANRFLYLLSSYNPDATNVDDDGVTYSESGEVYYYTAGTVEELNDVFRALRNDAADSAKPDGTSVAVDTITGEFRLRDASEVKVYTSAYLGNGQWGERVDVTDQVTVTADDQSVRVSGFDYASNYVSETAHEGTDSCYGSKLIVSFPIVPADTFGGNQLATNGTDAGLYLSGEETLLVSYPVPSADVELNYEITASDQVSYVPDSVSLSALIGYAEGYEPDGIHNAHVDIVYTMTAEDGTMVGTLSIPAGTAAENCSWVWSESEADTCGTYEIFCTVTPSDSGHYGEITRAASARAHVLHPVVELQDTVQTEGETADIQPGDYTDAAGLSDHYVSLRWICTEGLSPEELGEAESEVPTVGYRVASTEGVEYEGGTYVIRTTGDIPVILGIYRVSDAALSVDITEYAGFDHSCSRDDCGYDAETAAPFGIRCLIHVEGASVESTENEEPSGTEETDESTETNETDEEETEEGTVTADTTGSTATVQTTAEVTVSVIQTAAEDIVESESESMPTEGETVVSVVTGTDSTPETDSRGAAQTGDDMPWLLWLLAAGGSAAALLVCLVYTSGRRRRS